MNKSAITLLSFVCLIGTTSVQALAATPLAANQMQPMPNYQLTLVAPDADSAYHKPAQSIEVSVQVRPNLRPFDKVVISMDGQPVAEGVTATIPTLGFNPGEHTLSVMIKDEQTGAQSASVSRKLYIIQNTQARKQSQAIAEQISAYNRLPWYQKAYVRLRQDDKSIPNIAKKPLPASNGNNEYGNKGSAFQ